MGNLLTGKPVIVPWDFSELSLDALERALSIVDDNSLIHVVHVAQIPTPYEPVFVWGAVTEESLDRYANESFKETVKHNPQLEGVTFVTLFGDPGTLISDYAQEVDAELIVVSSHGRTGVKRFLLGSVAERIVRHAPCPVLVLRQAVVSE